MQGRFVFVKTDSDGHIQKADRRAIRHHCVSGKNRQPTSRRSRRDAAVKEWHQAAIDSQEAAKEQFSATFDVDRAEAGSQPIGTYLTSVPRPPPSDWALFRFAGPLDKFAQISMHKYFAKNPIRDPLCPYRHFGIHLKYDLDPISCFKVLVADQMCFHAILLMCSASNDLISNRPLSRASHRHLQRTLPLLNDRLLHPDAPHDDHVLYAIGILISINILYKDYATAQIHSRGLARIFKLRSGIVKRQLSSPIAFSLERLNFSSALITESWIPIFVKDCKKPPNLPELIPPLYGSRRFLDFDDLVDYNLATTLKSFQKISVLFDLNVGEAKPMNSSLVQHCISYMQSTLLTLKQQNSGDVSRSVHLGLLVLLATTFRLPGVYQHPCCVALSDVVKTSLVHLDEMVLSLPQEGKYWLVVIYMISTGNLPIGILADWASAMVCLSWGELKETLHQVFWIAPFHDDLGRIAYERLLESGLNGTF